MRLSPTPQFMRLDATLHFLGSAGGSAGLALFAGVSFGVASFFSLRGRPRLGGFTDVKPHAVSGVSPLLRAALSVVGIDFGGITSALPP